MGENTVENITVELSGLTLQEVSEIPAYLTADEKIPESLVRGLYSNDLQIRGIAVTKIRKIQAVQPVIDAGLVPSLISLLDSDDTRLQLLTVPKSEATWIVTNIASGTTLQTSAVVEAGAIPKLIKLSASPNEDLSDSAVWALANIVGDSPNLRDRVEDEGGIDAFVRLLEDTGTTPTKVQRRAMWGISNYLNPRSSNNLSVMKINHLIPCLARYIEQAPLDEATSEDGKESIEYAILAVSRMIDRGLKRSDVIETGVIPRLVHLLVDSSSSCTLQKHALHCIGYFLDGDDDAADAVIDAGLLPALLALVEGENQELCRTALYSASNIAAGSQSQIHALLECGLFKPVVRILIDDYSSIPCQREACWTMANLSMRVSGDEKVGQAFMAGGGVASLSAALLIPDQKTKELAVEGITSLLDGDDSEGSRNRDSILAAIRSSLGPQNLRAIRYSRDGRLEDHELREACHTLLTRYFPEYSKRARV
ncbi:Importin subunit alpha-4 [Tulasnella sp. UAMH 9824]|nr:Importin subunit alpha-4 [Tulasnella sp. UAMH 9824]